MEETGIAGLIIVLFTFLTSYLGFRDKAYFYKYKFQTEQILSAGDYKRLITSGFLHSNWTHLIFNMFSLYCFAPSIELDYGLLNFVWIYFGSLIGGSLLLLYIHRNHPDYSAIGASGAVCGIVFASIALHPGMEVGIAGFYIAGWAYGLLYILFCIFGVRNQTGSIAHEAHLGGSLTGLLIAIIIHPESLRENYLPIMTVLIPGIVFFYFLLLRPGFLLTGKFMNKPDELLTMDERYNHHKKLREEELDRILEKIHHKGMDSLSKAEKEKLEMYSQQIR